MQSLSFENTFGVKGPDDIYLKKCEEKITYEDVEEAENALAASRTRYNDDTLGKFICPYCGNYHLGHGHEQDQTKLISGHVDVPLSVLSDYKRPSSLRAKEMFLSATPVVEAADEEMRRIRLFQKLGHVTLFGEEYMHEYPDEKLWIKRVGVKAGEYFAFLVLRKVIDMGYATDLEQGNFGLKPEPDVAQFAERYFKERYPRFFKS